MTPVQQIARLLASKLARLSVPRLSKALPDNLSLANQARQGAFPSQHKKPGQVHASRDAPTQVAKDTACGIEVLEHLYATQYMAPGALCCFAGRTLPAAPQPRPGPRQGSGTTALAVPEGAQQQQQQQRQQEPEHEPPALFTHALHLRFQSLQARRALSSCGSRMLHGCLQGASRSMSIARRLCCIQTA